ncbi:inorganic phosphate transporter [Thermococcus sp. GR7]|uniref:inorganic phosphate transporter n=1 Tax=unclassified Thermococcus TaxID=2627626 RepID=UPI001431E77C|nr:MULTISPECIES: inorganic phosphate transporter [unclassified Thermococcus]NJE46600.1 inorganic phosphate transporter [Thermococcus sp. GR7]NJE79047.1 inorganic phosphate transporter [Thermococcus sp. GR4]NJF23569.1 inorganic phosphate transporter [Thermococcus sp. GR5]
MMLIIAALFMAWAIGANDSAKAVGTAVGSGVIGFKRAVLLIGIFTTLGALLGGSGVSGTVSGLAEGMGAPTLGLVLFSAAVAVTIASLWGKPISTTQSLIGALTGASLALGLSVDWGTLGRITLAWVLSPILAALTAIVVYRLYSPVLKRIKCLKNLELTQRWLIFTAASFSAFNLGANELSNVAGILESLGFDGPFKVVLALMLAIGALTFSYEVMMTVGRDLSPLGPTSAFSSQLGASLAVSAANLLGLPVSSGQAIIGAISGLSAYKGEHVNVRVLLGIVRGWILGPLAAGGLAYLLVGLLA